MLSFAQIADTLTDALRLRQPPIAVCFTDSVPADVTPWPRQSPAGCRFWQEAASQVFTTSAADHRLCSIGSYTHNLDLSPASGKDLEDALKVFADLTYVRAEDVAQIPVLRSKPKHVVYGPLTAISMPPDVVLLFVRADQTLILSEASQQLEGGMPPAMGRPACAIIPQAFNSGRSALSLGCCGARAYLDVLTDDVALYAIPGASIAAFADRVAALSKANLILSKFHQIRRHAVESGGAPTVAESLAALESGG